MSRRASGATPNGTVGAIDVTCTCVLGGERLGLEITVFDSKVAKSDLLALPATEELLLADCRGDDSRAEDSQKRGEIDIDGEEFVSATVELWEVCTGKYNDAIDPWDLLFEPVERWRPN